MAAPKAFKIGDRVKVTDKKSSDLGGEGKVVTVDVAQASCTVQIDGETAAKTFTFAQLEAALV